MSDTDRARDIIKEYLGVVAFWPPGSTNYNVAATSLIALIEPALTAARAEGFAAGEQAERAAIVKYLRHYRDDLADDIERADHLPKESKE